MSKQVISHLRQEYEAPAFDVDTVSKDPIHQFGIWFNEALESGILEPNAMFLSTRSLEGRPSGRIVLLKSFDHRGFVFFTNYESRKGQELHAFPYATLTFWWDRLMRQIRIEGIVEKVSAKDSTDYFQTRPRGSQISAWASPQSQIIDDREVLEAQIAEYELKFEGREVLPRPEHWGGYVVIPDSIEFWQGRSNRLHDRLLFTNNGQGHWTLARLAP